MYPQMTRHWSAGGVRSRHINTTADALASLRQAIRADHGPSATVPTTARLWASACIDEVHGEVASGQTQTRRSCRQKGAWWPWRAMASTTHPAHPR
jgi:hypothetical protein